MQPDDYFCSRMKIQPTVAFHTLGCKLNFSESSQLERQFEQAGYRVIPFDDGAGVYVINTCSVTENADRECKAVVNRAVKRNPACFIAVTGCYAQLKPNAIAALDGVDLVAGASEKFNLAFRIGRAVKKQQAEVFACDIATVTDFVPARSGTRTRTFLKVQDGCDYTCSFCTIPLARGQSRSSTIDHVLEEARQAVAAGTREIILTGVNLGDFRCHDGTHMLAFIDLLQALDGIDGVERFRISSIEPNLLTNSIIEFVAQSKKFVPHFHIPLQSGSDRILKLMRRRYLSGLYRDRVDTIKSLMPHAGIGADVITGFPGETTDDFIKTADLIESLDISYMHVFTYSERDHTDAVILPGSVPVVERKRRTTVLRELSDRKRHLFHMRFEGEAMDVLFETGENNGAMMGYTGNYIRVSMPYENTMANTLQRVVLTTVSAEGTMAAMMAETLV